MDTTKSSAESILNIKINIRLFGFINCYFFEERSRDGVSLERENRSHKKSKKEKKDKKEKSSKKSKVKSYHCEH